jgi:hypothetical protein
MAPGSLRLAKLGRPGRGGKQKIVSVPDVPPLGEA